MPYIKQSKRLILNPLIEDLDILIQSEGDLNYVITKLIDSYYGAGNYDELNSAMGVLFCVAFEFYRRRIVPYESLKCSQNGEVFEC